MKRLLILGLLMVLVMGPAKAQEVSICDYVMLQLQIIDWQNKAVNDLKEALDKSDKAGEFRKNHDKFDKTLESVQKAIDFQHKVFKRNCTQASVPDAES